MGDVSVLPKILTRTLPEQYMLEAIKVGGVDHCATNIPLILLISARSDFLSAFAGH